MARGPAYEQKRRMKSYYANEGAEFSPPDLGAYELGAPLPHYGPRPEHTHE